MASAKEDSRILNKLSKEPRYSIFFTVILKDSKKLSINVFSNTGIELKVDGQETINGIYATVGRLTNGDW